MHLIPDNYSAHKHADVQRSLGRYKRLHPHFTPTFSSWLNLIERWFRDLDDKALRRGSSNSVPDLIAPRGRMPTDRRQLLGGESVG